MLPKHPGKCSRLHGHSFGLVVSVEGRVSEETGFVMDYGVLREIVMEHVVSKLDHTHLGQGNAMHSFSLDDGGWLHSVPYLGALFYPSAENLSRAIYKLLAPFIHNFEGVTLAEVTIEETCTSGATWRREDEDVQFTHKQYAI